MRRALLWLTVCLATQSNKQLQQLRAWVNLLATASLCTEPTPEVHRTRPLCTELVCCARNSLQRCTELVLCAQNSSAVHGTHARGAQNSSSVHRTRPLSTELIHCAQNSSDVHGTSVVHRTHPLCTELVSVAQNQRLLCTELVGTHVRGAPARVQPALHSALPSHAVSGILGTARARPDPRPLRLHHRALTMSRLAFNR